MRYIVILFVLLFITSTNVAQNLLNTSTWTIGNGSVTGFSANGTAAENHREFGLDHISNEVILWKAIPDANNNADGGWNSSWINIDHTKTYRLTVWIKKSNSHDGRTYFGCKSWSSSSNQTLNLNSNVNTNPYFWNGDLPRLDRWYLLVGYVHSSSYNSTQSIGKIYDGVTGEVVLNMTDFKFSSNATNLRHRAYLHYDTNTLDRQYFYAPRLEEVNGGEWDLNTLLSLNPDSKLVFNYDMAGNQVQRFYCDNDTCIIPIPPSFAPDSNTDDEVTSRNQEEKPIPHKDNLLEDNNFSVYPNPTKGIITVQLSNQLFDFNKQNYVYTIDGRHISNIPIHYDSNTLCKIDLSRQPSGIYVIHLHLNDGQAITKQIIKE